MASDPIDPPVLPSNTAYVVACEVALRLACPASTRFGLLLPSEILVSSSALRVAAAAAILSYGTDYRNSIPQIYTAP